jgi:NADP-reducing hydrogenase subunit HndB
MAKIKTFEDLSKLKIELKSKLELREKSDSPEKLVQVRVAMATCGIASGARQVMEFFVEQLDKRNINAVVTRTGCMGYCYAEPTVEVIIPGREAYVFGYVNTAKADEIIEKYIKNGELVDGIIPATYRNIDNKE